MLATYTFSLVKSLLYLTAVQKSLNKIQKDEENVKIKIVFSYSLDSFLGLKLLPSYHRSIVNFFRNLILFSIEAELSVHITN